MDETTQQALRLFISIIDAGGGIAGSATDDQDVRSVRYDCPELAHAYRAACAALGRRPLWGPQRQG